MNNNIFDLDIEITPMNGSLTGNKLTVNCVETVDIACIPRTEVGDKCAFSNVHCTTFQLPD